jgi:hypothetical protein
MEEREAKAVAHLIVSKRVAEVVEDRGLDAAEGSKKTVFKRKQTWEEVRGYPTF